MKLIAGQKVDFFQDYDRKQDWYIQIKGDNSGECVIREYGSTAIMISAKSIAAKFRESLGINDDKLHRFRIGPYDSKINMWPILAIKNPTLLNRM